MCGPVVQYLSLLFSLFCFEVHAGKLEQVTNFKPTMAPLLSTASISIMVLFRYCSLGDNTTMPDGIHARLCHAFLLFIV